MSKIKENHSKDIKQVHVFYSGMVQGVGFRFTAQYIALNLNLKGWVKNIPDGRVELVAEGEEEILKTLLDRIKNGILQSHIRKEEVKWKPASGQLGGFEIRF